MKANQQRNTSAKKTRPFRKMLLHALDLPMDADGDVLKITMVADSDLLIENHTGIIRYTDTLIRLHTDHGILRVEGKRLLLSELAAERAYVRGDVFGWFLESKIDSDAR